MGQRGVSLITVLALMALAIPIVTAALSLASTLSIDSRVKTGILRSQYNSIGGSEYILHRLIHDPAYVDSLPVGEEAHETITLNGVPVELSVTKNISPLWDPPPANITSSRRLQSSKVVTPTTGTPWVLTTFTYTITVENRDDEPENLTKIHDGLPEGFSYVPHSTSGVTTSEPSVSGQRLTWDLGPLHIVLPPGASAHLTFDAQASVGDGNYCNEAWAEPGRLLTSSGPAARVKIGTTLDDLCLGQAVSVTKTVNPSVAAGMVNTTFTYTIRIENFGTEAMKLSLLRDQPAAGYSYVAGSTTGTLTMADPRQMLFQGQMRLDWSFVPGVEIQPGEVRTLSFQVRGAQAPGNYWNEAMATFENFPYSIYTWPTAVIRVMGTFQTSATDGRSQVDSEVWVGSDSYGVARWELTR